MPGKLTILVGTMTGTAEMVAEEMSDALGEAGFETDVKAMDGLESGVFAGGGLFLIVTSTYGQGDVPDNAMTLYNDLCARKPDLGAVRYGLFSLGDRTYAETFNHGGKRFDEILSGCGARRVGDWYQHDASAGTVPEDEGVNWVRAWAEQAAAAEAEAA